MPTIEGEVIVDRPVDLVFDYVADQRNERKYNRYMIRSDKMTRGPVAKGTVFRSAVASFGRAIDMRIECTAYERPELLRSTTTMRQGTFDVTLTFEPVPGGTRMHWTEEAHLRGLYRLLGPAFTRLGRGQEERIWTSMKQCLESVAPARLPAIGHRPPGAPGRASVECQTSRLCWAREPDRSALCPCRGAAGGRATAAQRALAG